MNFLSIKKFKIFSIIFILLFSSIAFAQFNFGNPQGQQGGMQPPFGQPENQINQQMPIQSQNQQNLMPQMGGFDFGMPSSAADPEFVAQQKFAEAMTTAYTWISSNSVDFVKGCKEDRDGLVQKLNFVIQQAQETSTACTQFEADAIECNPETYCSNFEKGNLPLPPEARFAFRQAGYDPKNLTIDSLNETVILNVCMKQFENEMQSVKEKSEKMKEQIKSQLSGFKSQCAERKKFEEQMNTGFKLPGFGPMQQGPQMGGQGFGMACGTGFEPIPGGGCKKSEGWNMPGTTGPGGCKDIGPPPTQNCHTEPPNGCPERWECENQQWQYNQPQQYNQQTQVGGCQGTAPQCECGWNCNTGTYQCNPCQTNQEYNQLPQCGSDQHLEGNICVSNQQTQTEQPITTTIEQPTTTTTTEPTATPTTEQPPATTTTTEPTATPTTEQPSATTSPAKISVNPTGFQTLPADTTETTENQQTATTTNAPLPQVEPLQSIPMQQNGMEQRMQCPQGEYYGINDRGEKTCIRPSNAMGGGYGGTSMPGQTMQPQIQQNGGQGFGMGMPPEKLCELQDEDIIDMFAGNIQGFSMPVEKIKMQCRIEATKALRGLTGMKMQIAQCKANAALDCEAKKQMVESCKTVQSDSTPIAKSIVDSMCRRFGVSALQTDTKGKLYDLANKLYNNDPALANQLGDTADKTKEDQKKLDIISYLLGNGNYGSKLNERAQKLTAIKERLQGLGNADSETIAALESQVKELSDEASKFSNAFDITRLGYLFRAN